MRAGGGPGVGAQIGASHFPASFTILEQGGHDFLLGLDMLKRFQCAAATPRNEQRGRAPGRHVLPG